MLTSTLENVVISNLGWVDGGALWAFHVREQREERIAMGDAKYLTLGAGTEDHFSLLHHHEGSRIEITVHRFDDPGVPIGRAIVEGRGSTISGPASAWAQVAANYVAYYTGPSWADYALIRLDPGANTVSVQPFDWYTNTEYDKGYQGIVGVTEIPGDTRVLIAVQRDSRLVLYDPIDRTQCRLIELAGRGGNAALYFRRRAHELWAVDYDTIIKMDPASWRILAVQRVQAEDSVGTNQFVGGFSFTRDETLCVVARPFSGDVIALDAEDLRPRFRCDTGGQPLEAVLIGDGAVVARDWKSGRLLQGRMVKV